MAVASFHHLGPFDCVTLHRSQVTYTYTGLYIQRFLIGGYVTSFNVLRSPEITTEISDYCRLRDS
jgi:hypothetical protein